jgi:hypothetical protein
MRTGSLLTIAGLFLAALTCSILAEQPRAPVFSGPSLECRATCTTFGFCWPCRGEASVFAFSR